MNKHSSNFASLPAIDKLLALPEVVTLSQQYSHDLILYAARKAVSNAREKIIQNNINTDIQAIIRDLTTIIKRIVTPTLKPVVNATGVIIHTNLGRAPLSNKITEKVAEILQGYSTLEVDLETGGRGNRGHHLSELISYITGAEDAIVVNNTAAALVLVLNILANNKEVIASRGELVEIGGSFRVPEIMAASGAIMHEVGTTNRTRINDYTKAINQNTALLLKTHTSNFSMLGFTEEVSLSELVELGKKNNLPVVYDIGSGLIKRPDSKLFELEPDVQTSLATGIDLILFSGDKLLGGPQAGIIAGKKKYIKLLASAPLMRALRTCKMTIAALTSVLRCYVDSSSFGELLLHRFAKMTPELIRERAQTLQKMLQEQGVDSVIVPSRATYGGGTMPNSSFESLAVGITSQFATPKKKNDFFQRMYNSLLECNKPIFTIFKKGELTLDVLTIQDSELAYVANSVAEIYRKVF